MSAPAMLVAQSRAGLMIGPGGAGGRIRGVEGGAKRHECPLCCTSSPNAEAVRNIIDDAGNCPTERIETRPDLSHS